MKQKEMEEVTNKAQVVILHRPKAIVFCVESSVSKTRECLIESIEKHEGTVLISAGGESMFIPYEILKNNAWIVVDINEDILEGYEK